MGNPKKKIAYILTPITFGGAEKVSLNFLKGVDRNCFDICPVLLTRPWEDAPFFMHEILKLGYSFDTLPVARNAQEGMLRVTRVANRLYSILKKGSFDLVHTHGYFADICGLPIARLLGIPSLSTCHGFIENDHKLKIYNRLDVFALKCCRTVIAVSEGLKTELIQKGIDPSRIAVIQNAVPLSINKDVLTLRQDMRNTLAIASYELVVGYAGRLSEEKGLVYLIHAITQLHDAGIPVKLLIVGDGPQRNVLEKMVTRRLNGHVIFAGFQVNIENWLPAFDIFVLPSLTEGTPMALLEAMAAGIPVIGTAVGGVPKVLTDGINGMLVPPADSKAISGKLKLLIGNPGLMREIGKKAVETIKADYNLNRWCKTIEDIYH